MVRERLTAAIRTAHTDGTWTHIPVDVREALELRERRRTDSRRHPLKIAGMQSSAGDDEIPLWRVIVVHRNLRPMLPMRSLHRVAIAGLATAAVIGALGVLPAEAYPVTTSGQVTITPGWTTNVFDRDALVLPFTVTAPCETTDFGTAGTLVNCDDVRVELLSPSSPVDVDSTVVMPADNGTGSGSLSIYGYMLQGFGPQIVRITDITTGETTSTQVTLEALTRTAATISRTRKAPAAATLAVTGTLTAFTGSDFTTPPGTYALMLQRQVGGRWVTARTVTTSNGSANLNVKVSTKAAYRVCHLADAQSTASCTSARTL